MALWLALIGLGLLAGACASAPAPVPVLASSEELALLEGVWRGEYSSAATGRSGSIRFALAAEERTAVGEVLMVPRQADATPEPVAELKPRGPERLEIRFVRIDGGRITGTVGPYRDPDCGCPVATTFTGRRQGDVIGGEYVTRGGPGHLPVRGSWTARRQPE